MDSLDKDLNTYYNLKGQETDKDGEIYAKKTPKTQFVAEFMGRLYEKNTLVKRMDRDRFKLREVGPQCFENYLQYLKTNRESRYLMAERNHID